MIKTRFGLFSGVFLMVVGVAHSWPQRAAAVCIDPTAPALCFDGFLNRPLPEGGATTLVKTGGHLVVGNLLGTRAVGSTCTAPTSGDEITIDDPDDAGKRGYSVDLDDTEIPTDTTAYFVELDGYWGVETPDLNRGRGTRVILENIRRGTVGALLVQKHV